MFSDLQSMLIVQTLLFKTLCPYFLGPFISPAQPVSLCCLLSRPSSDVAELFGKFYVFSIDEEHSTKWSDWWLLFLCSSSSCTEICCMVIGVSGVYLVCTKTRAPETLLLDRLQKLVKTSCAAVRVRGFCLKQQIL